MDKRGFNENYNISTTLILLLRHFSKDETSPKEKQNNFSLEEQ